MEINFLNEPKFSEHEADAKFNERRKYLTPLLKDYILTHQLFSDKKVDVTFLHTGISSLVCIIDTADKKYVLKIALSILTSGLEGTFLNRWKQIGIPVPDIFEEGKIDNYFYVLMEYVGIATLSEKYTTDELIDKKVYRDLGDLLRKMHEIKTTGYSNIVNDKKEPQYSDITTWYTNDIRTREQIKYVQENHLLNEAHGSIEEACDVILSHIGQDRETVYCHNDFHVGNVFATESLTVFDPWPCFHHPYMDIARSIALASKAGLTAVSNQFLGGYFKDEKYDTQLLQAFMILIAWIKFPYMHKTNNTKAMDDLRAYLSETSLLLKD